MLKVMKVMIRVTASNRRGFADPMEIEVSMCF
jgi:hypothetical protein